jgi:hypothetical protein
MSGKIYIMSNRLIPGLRKVGKTGRETSVRENELSKPTGVPAKWKTEFYIERQDPGAFEISVHADLQYGHPFRAKREYFQLPLEEIREVIQRKIELPNIKPVNALGERVAPWVRRIWSSKRRFFWKELEQFRKVVPEISQTPLTEENYFLCPEIESEDRLQQLRRVVTDHKCHMFAHRMNEDWKVWTCLNLFSRTGICFAIFDVAVSQSRKYPHHYYRENPLTTLAKMCDALTKCEDDIFRHPSVVKRL